MAFFLQRDVAIPEQVGVFISLLLMRLGKDAHSGLEAIINRFLAS